MFDVKLDPAQLAELRPALAALPLLVQELATLSARLEALRALIEQAAGE